MQPYQGRSPIINVTSNACVFAGKKFLRDFLEIENLQVTKKDIYRFYNNAILNLINNQTPYEIMINGIVDNQNVDYVVTVSLEIDTLIGNQYTHIFIVEDSIFADWSYNISGDFCKNIANQKSTIVKPLCKIYQPTNCRIVICIISDRGVKHNI